MIPFIITYWPYLAMFLVVIMVSVFLIRKNPDIAFWLLLNIFVDPGGYISYYFGGKIFSLYISDIVIPAILFCLYVINTNYKIIFKDQFFVSFLKVFSVFVAYYFIVYGAIVPYLNNDLNYVLFLQKNRMFLYYIIILISAYIFAQRGLKYFYMTTLFTGVFILSAFLISLVTGFQLVPIFLLERYEGSGIMRISMYSWGLYSLLLPLSLILFILPHQLKLKIKYRKLAYIAGILMLFTTLIALNRRNFLSLPGTVLIIVLYNSFIFRRNKALAFAKVLIPMGAALVIINFTMPKYIDYITEISQDTFELLLTGKDTRGEGDYRVSGTADLEISKKYISDNFFFGTGYTYIHWESGLGGGAVTSRGPVYAAAMDAAGEVPVYYIFFGYGLAGFIIMLFLYSFIIRLFLKLFKHMRNKINVLIEHPYEVLFALFILYSITDKFTYSAYSLGTDFTAPINGMTIGIEFALLQKLYVIASKADASSSENLEIG